MTDPAGAKRYWVWAIYTEDQWKIPCPTCKEPNDYDPTQRIDVVLASSHDAVVKRAVTPERAKQLLACRDALIHDDKHEAYHQLSQFCESFGGDAYLHWDAVERIAANEPKGEGV